MVFSFFKKQPQKMPERTAARPRAPLPEMKLNPPPAEVPVRQRGFDDGRRQAQRLRRLAARRRR